jgi:hypothetical protein
MPPAERPEFTPLPADEGAAIPLPGEEAPAEMPAAEAAPATKKKLVVRRLKKKTGAPEAEPAPAEAAPAAAPEAAPEAAAAEQVAKADEEPDTEGYRLGRALRRAGMRSDREPISSRKTAAAQAKAKGEAKTRTDVKARAKGKLAPAVPCRKCKEEIPEGELVCPACGANRPKGRMVWLWILMPTLVLVLGLFALAVFTEMLDPLVKDVPGVKTAVEKTRVFFGEKGWIKLPAPPAPGAPQK